MAKIPFERVPCGRCGGGGKYSFNLMHGDRCYGCGGSGEALSKRGKAARAFWLASLEKPVGEIKPGHQVYASISLGHADAWCWVESIEPDLNVRYNDEPPGSRMRLELKRKGLRCSFSGYGPDSKLKSVVDQADLDAKIAAALAYQDSLDDKGKPIKGKASKMVDNHR